MPYCILGYFLAHAIYMQELKIAIGEAGLVLCSALKQGLATEVEGVFCSMWELYKSR